ncbi:hypothetical protein E2C01_046840 [Portunus trituberculatus]|uniref:Uncharacterized protein n=1 Tax=Portunus trituberculatus TaxID=210409 RepID=A0A5B7G5T8_PORTR|nr:hypothetical protein [Portunus trituberculatus]
MDKEGNRGGAVDGRRGEGWRRRGSGGMEGWSFSPDPTWHRFPSRPTTYGNLETPGTPQYRADHDPRTLTAAE